MVVSETIERPTGHFWQKTKEPIIIKRGNVVFDKSRVIINDPMFGEIQVADVQVEEVGHSAVVVVWIGKKPIEIYNASGEKIQVVPNQMRSFPIFPNGDNSVTFKAKNGKREVTFRVENDDAPPQEFAPVGAKLNPSPSSLQGRAVREIPRES
ncbi:MAG: hypothetical protein HYW62_00690 [Candidatus Levybacteria bacterium]|nr:hypothetical protein [Candidatus Levybacteria bacterium]